MVRGKLSTVAAFIVGVFVVMGLQVPLSAGAATAPLSAHSWDSGLFATTTSGGGQVHAWGKRATAGAWGTGSVNYQSGATTVNRGAASGSLSVRLDGTACANGTCGYGSGSGYKALVQLWNDPANFIAFGLINDPGVSRTGTTLMIEGSAGGRPVGGYWPAGALSGSSHVFDITWSSQGVRLVIDGTSTLGPYPVAATYPSISFLSAGRNTGDVVDTTFNAINFSAGAISNSPFGIPTSTPYLTYSATLTQGGTGSGYSAYINAHDAASNAIAIGIQSDTAARETGLTSTPYYIWERVQGGRFTYGYIGPATPGPHVITLKWWKTGTALFYVDGSPIAEIPLTLSPRLFFNAEGNARKNGDSVSSTVSNVQIAVGDNCPSYCGLNGGWNTSSFNFYGLRATRTNSATQNGANFSITGTVSGLPSNGDWDNHLVAGIGMIAQYWNGQ
jgi:hypothetical protein